MNKIWLQFRLLNTIKKSKVEKIIEGPYGQNEFSVIMFQKKKNKLIKNNLTQKVYKTYTKEKV